MPIRHRPLIAALLCGIVGAAGADARDRAWTRLEMPNFTVISAASPADTLNWAVEFDQFHRGLGQILQLHEAAIRPVTVVFFHNQSDLKPYKPLENGRPANLQAYFSRAAIGNYIALAGGDMPARTRLIIFHEGTHWLTNVSDIPMPLWLNEGLAEVFSTFAVEKDSYSYGSALPWHVEFLTRHSMMPLKALLEVRNGSLMYNEGTRSGLFYAESWAFVHYLLFSNGMELVKKFDQLTATLKPESDPDQVFQQVFGCDCGEMDRRLAQYLTGGAYSRVRIKFDRSAVERQASVRPATPAEVELAESSLLVCLNRGQEAMPRLERLAPQMPDNLQLLEASGLAASEVDRPMSAQQFMLRAAALGSRNSLVYSYLGDAMLGINLSPGRRPVSVSAAQASLAIDYYHRDLELNPLDQHAYDNIASSLDLLNAASLLERRDLLRGSALYPDDSAIKVGLAVIDLKTGQRDHGVAILRAIASNPAATPLGIAGYAQFILSGQLGR